MDTQDNILEQNIKKRIKELEKERDELITGANKAVAAYQGAIAELKKLLNPPTPPPTE